MKSGRRIERQLLVILLLLGVFPPAVALAGHGVEDTVETTLPVEKVKQLIDAGEKLTFIDLRPAKEFQEKRIPGACSILLAEWRTASTIFPSPAEWCFIATKPYDVADRAVFLEYRGYRNIFVMPEGYAGWVKRGYPLETTRR